MRDRELIFGWDIITDIVTWIFEPFDIIKRGHWDIRPEDETGESEA